MTIKCKHLLVVLLVCMGSLAFACDVPMLLLKSKAVLKDGSSFTAYFMFTDDVAWEKSPFKGFAGLSMQDGTDYLPAILAPEGGYDEANNTFLEKSVGGSIRYVKDFFQLPWGYYLNDDDVTWLDTASMDSLIYLSAKLPPQFRLSSYWDTLNNKQLKLLQSRFCDIDYAEGPMDDIIYVCTRDTISSDELELYTLHENCGGDNEKKSYDTSFFYNTAGNKAWLQDDQIYYERNRSVFYRSMVESLQYNKARLQSLIPLVDRNVAMPAEFKLTLKQEIKAAIDNIDLLVIYMNMPKKHSRPAKKLFAQISAKTKHLEAKGYPPGDKLWNTYVRIALPRLTNSFFIEDYSESRSKDIEAAMDDMGIVVLFGFY